MCSTVGVLLLRRFSVGLAVEYSSCFISVLNLDLSHLVTKPTKGHVRPAKTQISLGIHKIWSESSLSAWRNLGSLATHWADAQADLSLRWAHTHFVGFVTRRLKVMFAVLKQWWLIGPSRGLNSYYVYEPLQNLERGLCTRKAGLRPQ